MFFYERFNVKKGDFQRAMVYFSHSSDFISFQILTRLAGSLVDH